MNIMKYFSAQAEADYRTLINQGALIIDVRSPEEFKGGHIKGSENIPLDKIREKTAELKLKNKAIITCCRSGNRSGMAKDILQAAGIECYNGGAWNSLERSIR